MDNRYYEIHKLEIAKRIVEAQGINAEDALKVTDGVIQLENEYENYKSNLSTL
jgi:hypothetical protein